MHADWWHSKINACAKWTRLIARSTGNSNIMFGVVPYVQDLAGRIRSDQYIFTFLHEVKHAVLQSSVLLPKVLFPIKRGQISWWCPILSDHDIPHSTTRTTLPLRSTCEQHCLLNLILSQSRMDGKKAGVSTLRPRNPYMNEISENLSTSMIS